MTTALTAETSVTFSEPMRLMHLLHDWLFCVYNFDEEQQKNLKAMLSSQYLYRGNDPASQEGILLSWNTGMVCAQPLRH